MAARSRKQKSKLKTPPYQFAVTEIFGCSVSCSIETWNKHILSRPVGAAHAELAGREDDVKQALIAPHDVYPSNSPDSKGNAFVYENQTASDYVRAVVAMNNPALITTGGSKGYLVTAYTARTQYSATPIYTKPKAPPVGS